MNQKFSITIAVIAGLVIIGGAFYFVAGQRPISTTIPPASTATTTTYTNGTYGFSFTLPLSWLGYTIVKTTWQGSSLDAKGQNYNSVSGPEISIRHPLWTATNPRQDVPIMIFTIAQWNDLQTDKFHIGAAPIGPSELGRNNAYVFALPARYNFAFLTGYQEVDQLVHSGALQTF